MTSLEELRQRIDSLDERIVELLNARAETAVKIGQIKNAQGSPVFAPDRELAVLERISAISNGPLAKTSLRAIYRELMSASFSLERPPRVGYLGPEGSFSHEAAMGKFGASVEYEPLLDLEGVFEAMARGHIDYGVVPVENNSTGGVVIETLDAFSANDVHICNEIHRAIHHSMMANCPLSEVTAVYSKPEAFNQCRNWIAEMGLNSKLVEAASTSQAAQRASKERGIGAIGSALAGRLYCLKILAANIEDNPRNATRFFVLGNEPAKPTGDDRTSLLFITAHKAGALVEVLLVFQKRGINMTMITSRPSARTSVEYNFFVDIDGHADDPVVKEAIAEAQTHCRTLRVLGSYPKATEIVAA